MVRDKTSSNIRILQIGNISGMPQGIRNALRKLGCTCDVISFFKHPFGYDVDILYPSKQKLLIGKSRKFIKLLRIHSDYDIFHFHVSSVMHFGLDLPVWKALGKKIVINYRGSEIRNKKPPFLHTKLADVCLVSTPDLLEFVPRASWLPNPIDLDQYRPTYPDPSPEVIRILHAPSNRDLKGTSHVEEAVKSLKTRGYPVELVLLENVSHDVVISELARVDIVVDQLILGWYGVFSMEAMATGKPVLCYIKPELLDRYPSLPVINTNATDICGDLEQLIRDGKLRVELGKRGREYIENVHDSRKICKKLLELYSA